jgi:hypothetical protein
MSKNKKSKQKLLNEEEAEGVQEEKPKIKVEKEATFMEIINPLSQCDKILLTISILAALCAAF